MGALTDGRASRKRHASRPAREDHELPTPFEDGFSGWKVLVGHNDWQNHHKRQEGERKYRVHNLPGEDGFHPGVYELALYLDKSINAHGTRKATSSSLGKDAFVPVYVGQTENVRERLQHYGRSGSHLEGSLQEGKCLQCGTSYITEGQKNLGSIEKIVVCSNQELCSSPHLFTRAFFQGYSIAFRWTRTESKDDAANLETRLLQSFDYAWNTGSNGKRRPEDATKKLQKIIKAKSLSNLSKLIDKLQKIGPGKIRNLCEKRVATNTFFVNLWGQLDNLAARKSGLLEITGQMLIPLSFNGRRNATKEKTLPYSELICIQKHNVDGHSETSVCGIMDDNGNICTSIPLPGRKQCKAHKGMRRRLRPSAGSSILTMESFENGPSESSVCIVVDTKADNFSLLGKVSACKGSGMTKPICESDKGGSLVCGYILKDGLKCMALPEKGSDARLTREGT